MSRSFAQNMMQAILWTYFGKVLFQHGPVKHFLEKLLDMFAMRTISIVHLFHGRIDNVNQ